MAQRGLGSEERPEQEQIAHDENPEAEDLVGEGIRVFDVAGFVDGQRICSLLPPLNPLLFNLLPSTELPQVMVDAICRNRSSSIRSTLAAESLYSVSSAARTIRVISMPSALPTVSHQIYQTMAKPNK
jgi:hypothetical protein